MDRVDYRQQAVKDAQAAAYVLNTAYKITREPKTLLLVADHALSSMMASVSALLSFERSKKTIPPYHDTTESKLNAFRQHLVRKYSLKPYSDTIQNILDIGKERKEAPVEFSRDMKYVICSDNYENVRTVSEDDVKNYIDTAKEFVSVVERLTAHE